MKRLWKPRFLRVGSDCVLYHDYTLDPLAFDHSGNGNNGTIYGATPQTIGMFFQTDDYIDVPFASNLSPGTNDYAAMAWINPTYVSQTLYMILSMGGAILIFSAYQLAEDAYGTWSDYVQTAPGGSNYYYDIFSLPHVDCDGSWHFLSYEIDRNVGAYIRLDGNALIGPFGDTYETAITFSTYCNIGVYNNHTSAFFSGLIDFLQVYNGTFNNYSGKTSLEIYNATKARYGL
jgi:hypothetical protein